MINNRFNVVYHLLYLGLFFVLQLKKKIMIKFIKKLYKKWDDWENEEVTINLGYDYITTNNYTIQLFILIFLFIIIIWV